MYGLYFRQGNFKLGSTLSYQTYHLHVPVHLLFRTVLDATMSNFLIFLGGFIFSLITLSHAENTAKEIAEILRRLGE